MTAIADFLKKQGKELKPNTLKDNVKNITKNEEFVEYFAFVESIKREIEEV